MERGRLCLRKDLNDKEFGQDKVLVVLLGVELPVDKLPLQAP